MYSDSAQRFKKWLAIIFLTPILFFSTATFADLVVIVNPSNKVDVDKESVKKIFMGRSKTFINGEKANPIDMKKGALRAEFLKTFLNKDEGSLQSYWTRLVFTGKGTPPQQFATENEIKKMVASDIHAIGYIDKENIDKTVRVIETKK